MTDKSTDVTSHHPIALPVLVRKLWKFTTVIGVVGALAGFAASEVVKPRWVAKVSVQIGQLASVGPGNPARLIENQLTTVDRYNLPDTRLRVVQELRLPTPEESPNARLVFETLRASPSKSPDILNLQVSGYSRADALAAMQASFAVVSAEHHRLFDPSYLRMQGELGDATSQLQAAERDYEKTLSSLKPSAPRSGSGSASSTEILITNLATTLNAQLLDLKRQIAQLQEALDPGRSYPTRVLGEIYVPQNPSTPGALLLTVGGALLGLVVGGLIGFLRLSIRNKRRHATGQRSSLRRRL